MATASYAFWNNKGGVGKSFLSFVAATEYAYMYPSTDVYVIDLCPQAKVSEMLLRSSALFSKNGNAKRKYAVDLGDIPIHKLMHKKPRATIAGYIEARLNSPFRMIEDVSPYVCRPRDFNKNVPKNVVLVCGDNLLEILSEAIRQTSQLSIPVDSWKQVLLWVKDLTNALRQSSGNRDTLFIIDCNPSFAIYTQLALLAADNIIVPFTADDSSRRGIENVVALLYGHSSSDPQVKAYANINFVKRAREEHVDIPKLHTFVSNRVTLYEGKPSTAYEAMMPSIKKTVDDLYTQHPLIYARRGKPSSNFIVIPDYHDASVVMATTGTPLHKLPPKIKTIRGTRVQLNPESLDQYRQAIGKFVCCL